jgi:hypothetical protein
MHLSDYITSLIVFFFMVVYFMMIFYVIIDVFRSHDLTGIAKAVWLVLLLFIPVITLVLYVIVRGNEMSNRGSAPAKK